METSRGKSLKRQEKASKADIREEIEEEAETGKEGQNRKET